MGAVVVRAPRTGRSRRVRAVGVLALLSVAFGCSSGGSAAPAGSAVTLPAPMSGSAVACPLGIALVAVDEAGGAPQWSHCADRPWGIDVLAADDQVVLAAEHFGRNEPTTLLGLAPSRLPSA